SGTTASVTLRSNEQVNEAALGPYRCKRPPEPLVLAIRVRNTNHLDTNDFDGPFEPIIPDSGAYSVLAHSAGSQTRRERSAALLDAVSQDLRICASHVPNESGVHPGSSPDSRRRHWRPHCDLLTRQSRTAHATPVPGSVSSGCIHDDGA